MTRSLRASAALVNSQLPIAGPRLGGGSATGRKGDNLENPDAAVERQRDDAADVNLLARLLDAPAVDSDMALLDDVLREGAALHQPDEEEEAVDPHCLVIASGTKQSKSSPLDGFAAALLAMTVISS